MGMKENMEKLLDELSPPDFYNIMAAVRGSDSDTKANNELKSIFTARLRYLVFGEAIQSMTDPIYENRKPLERQNDIKTQILQLFNVPETKISRHYFEHLVAAWEALSHISEFRNEVEFMLLMLNLIYETMRSEMWV